MKNFLFSLLLIFSLASFIFCGDPVCDPNHRNDCGYVGINQQECEAKGCCWQPFEHLAWCFYKYSPPNPYVLTSYQSTSYGFEGVLAIQNSSNPRGPYGPDITPLHLSVWFDTKTRLHVKIFDPNNSRWTVPYVVRTVDPKTKPSVVDYSFQVIKNPFSFTVLRQSTGEVLFNSSGIIFEDQYLELTTSLPSPNYIYGLGEHVTSLPLQTNTYTMWASDHATPVNQNLYGSHPFYVDVRPNSGNAHGVFLLNSNGMDVVLGQHSLQFSVIGGIIDLYFFLGPTPESVVRQYTEVIGHPYLIPYWSLGFHQCRYGYKNLDEVKSVVAKYKSANIPLETMWNDIDYMNNYLDFTFDPVNYPPSQMNDFVNQLHANHQHYIIITDPGISYTAKNYPPLDDGNKLGIWILDASGQPFRGSVWPGPTYFADWFHPNAFQYWADQIATFHNVAPFDGLWIDMNEASNFCDGECDSEEVPPKRVGFDPNNPPYAINNFGSHAPLKTKTISPDAKHYNTIDYNVHNLFGMMESRATTAGLEKVRGKRAVVISRSTFPSSGAFAGHWTGDISSQWSDLYYTIPDMLSFNMFGIPFVGADIGGFNGDTTEELLSRWIELGAFYPFCRDHNTKGAAPQELYVWPSVANISRNVLAIRYSLLPYYYTLFAEVNNGSVGTVVRPLVFEFPTDTKAAGIDKQFLVGSGILVSPVLTQGASSVSAYFPAAEWYDFYSGQLVSKTTTPQTLTLNAPIDFIPLHIRGGTIIPFQEPAYTIYEARQNPFYLVVPFSRSQSSSGSLFLDDGDSLNVIQTGTYTYIRFIQTYSNGVGALMNIIDKNGYPDAKSATLTSVKFLGVPVAPNAVNVNGQKWSSYNYDSRSNILTLQNLQLSLSLQFSISWK